MADELELIHAFEPGRVRFRTERCWKCGRWWAYETFRPSNTRCPVCSGAQVADLEAKLEAALRSNRALRAKRKGRAKP